MTAIFRALIPLAGPWLHRFAFGRAVRTAGRSALRTSPFAFHAPNLLVSLGVVGTINVVNFLVMALLRGSAAAALVSAGLVAAATTTFVIHDVYNKRSLPECINRECLTLLGAVAVFLGVFAVGILVVDLWWLAFAAKLMLEVVLCYAVMLTKKEKFEAVQYRIVLFAMTILRVSKTGVIAGWLRRFAFLPA